MILTASANADCLLGSQNDVATIGLLIERGADSNAANKAGDAALHVLCRNEDSEGIEKLLECSADPALQNGEGETPLHVVSGQSEPDRVQLLLDHGGDVTKITSDAMGALTSMQVSCENRDAQSMAILLQASSDSNVSNGDGDTPLHLMTGYGFSESVGLQVDAGAPPEARPSPS